MPVHIQIAVTIALKDERELRELLDDSATFYPEDSATDHAAEITRKFFIEAAHDWNENQRAYGHLVKTEFLREDAPEPQ